MYNYNTICLSGGGEKGIAFIGALKYLTKNTKLNLSKITNWLGTSVGSIISFFFCLGYSIDEIEEFILNFNFGILEKSLIIDVDTFLTNYGLDDGTKIMYIIINFLKLKLNVNDITFIELYNITKKNLSMIGTNYTKGTEVCFNHINYPTLSVIKAIRISISVPLLFTPVLYNNDYYVDGGIINNLPIKYCDPKTSLGIYLKFTCNNKFDNIISYMSGCVNIMFDSLTEKDCSNPLNIITIDNNFTNLGINFDITKEIKEDIIKNGYNVAEKFINDIPNKISKKIINNIIDNLFSFKKNINKDVATQTDTISINN
jgi:predicted patatin/cPLA2 family phospholipase